MGKAQGIFNAGDSCCPDQIDSDNKNCATNLPPCVFSPGGFPTDDKDYSGYASDLKSGMAAPKGQVADDADPVGQSTTTFGAFGSSDERKTKQWLIGRRCTYSEQTRKHRFEIYGNGKHGLKGCGDYEMMKDWATLDAKNPLYAKHGVDGSERSIRKFLSE